MPNCQSQPHRMTYDLLIPTPPNRARGELEPPARRANAARRGGRTESGPARHGSAWPHRPRSQHCGGKKRSRNGTKSEYQLDASWFLSNPYTPCMEYMPTFTPQTTPTDRHIWQGPYMDLSYTTHGTGIGLPPNPSNIPPLAVSRHMEVPWSDWS